MANQNGTNIKHRLMRLKMGAETYCLKLASIASIERVDLLQRNFGAHEPIGWLTLVDVKMPVFSLDTRLNRPRPVIQVENRIKVLNIESNMYGLLVDEVLDV